MNSVTALGYMANVAAIYMLVYAVYLLMKTATQTRGLAYPMTPYDSSHLVLRRRYI
jgi:hypothetical protein